MNDMVSTIKSDIDNDREQIKLYERGVNALKNEIKMSKKKDKELREYVWSIGVLEEIDMNIFHTNYKSTKTKELEAEKKRLEHNLKRYHKRLNKDILTLAKYE